jgi:multiple sugar transport system substrate-binding protein
MAVAVLPSELPVYRRVIADFEATSGWRVVVVPQQYADIRRALAAETLSGHGTLDVVELDVYSLAAAARDAAPIGPQELGALGEILLPAALDAGRVEDGLRFLPHRLSWQAMLYDRAVLGEPPRTWDELLRVARAHPGRIGFKAALYEGLTCDLLPFVWSAGGSGEAFDDPGARAAFDLFAALAPSLSPHSATYKEATIAEALARGELVLHLNWPFAMALYVAQGLAPERLRSAPLPAGPAGRATVLGGGYLAVPRRSPRREGAFALVRHLLGHDAQARLARELGWFSPRRDVPMADPTGSLAGYEAMRGEVRPRPDRADYPRLSRAWQQAFRRVVLDRADPTVALRDTAATFARGSR